MTIDLLQYPGVLCGLIGAVLVSGASARSRRWGFLLWIGSNACLIAWSVAAGAWGLLAMYAVYSVTSVVGWKNNANPALATEVHQVVPSEQASGAAAPSLGRTSG